METRHRISKGDPPHAHQLIIVARPLPSSPVHHRSDSDPPIYTRAPAHHLLISRHRRRALSFLSTFLHGHTQSSGSFLTKMAPQSLDLGLSLGLGLVSQPSQPSFWYSGGNVAAEQEVGPTPTAAAVEERRCSPGSPASSGSGSGLKRGAERSAGSGDEDQDDDGGNARKKLRLSKDQAAVLEECFKTHHTLTPKQKLALANSLGLRPRQVEVWFQNRRARTKLKQTEVDCEYMKRWCEQLAEQNKRLEKEVAELRALKAAPAQQASPAATLTMCPSCRRVAATAAGPSATQHQHQHQQPQQCHPKPNAQPAGNVLPSHCQFFPSTTTAVAPDRSGRQQQGAWSGAAQPLVTRELF